MVQAWKISMSLVAKSYQFIKLPQVSQLTRRTNIPFWSNMAKKQTPKTQKLRVVFLEKKDPRTPNDRQGLSLELQLHDPQPGPKLGLMDSSLMFFQVSLKKEIRPIASSRYLT